MPFEVSNLPRKPSSLPAPLFSPWLKHPSCIFSLIYSKECPRPSPTTWVSSTHPINARAPLLLPHLPFQLYCSSFFPTSGRQALLLALSSTAWAALPPPTRPPPRQPIFGVTDSSPRPLVAGGGMLSPFPAPVQNKGGTLCCSLPLLCVTPSYCLWQLGLHIKDDFN